MVTCVVVHQGECPPGDQAVGRKHGTQLSVFDLCDSSPNGSVTSSIMDALVVGGNQGTTVRIPTRMDIPWPECIPSSYLIIRIKLDRGPTLVRFCTRKTEPGSDRWGS